MRMFAQTNQTFIKLNSILASVRTEGHCSLPALCTSSILYSAGTSYPTVFRKNKMPPITDDYLWAFCDKLDSEKTGGISVGNKECFLGVTWTVMIRKWFIGARGCCQCTPGFFFFFFLTAVCVDWTVKCAKTNNKSGLIWNILLLFLPQTLVAPLAFFPLLLNFAVLSREVAPPAHPPGTREFILAR